MIGITHIYFQNILLIFTHTKIYINNNGTNIYTYIIIIIHIFIFITNSARLITSFRND